MHEYSKVSPAIWESERFRGLRSDAHKLAFHYLLTCRHMNSCGCYALPLAYGAADLGWTHRKVRDAIQALVGAGLVVFDDGTQEVLILRWFQHNAPMNPKHRQGIEKVTKLIRSERLRKLTLEAIEGSGANLKIIGTRLDTDHMRGASKY